MNTLKSGGLELSEQSYSEIDRNVRACYNGKSELEIRMLVLKIALENREKWKWGKVR